MSQQPTQPFTPEQLRAFQIVARISSSLSLAGSSFTIISFLSYQPLRKPVNRLAFFIAVANFFGCLAYSWAQSPIHAGRDSAWCQCQGFLLTWFLMTDPLLVMIMSFNVFLTVRTKRNATELKRIDFIAVALAFILPFIQALTYLFWRPNGKTVYGPATLWCWIAKESALIRLVAFYIPIWCFVAVAILFLALSGKQILRVRKNVQSAKGESTLQQDEPPLGPDGVPLPRERRFSSFAKAFMGPVRRGSTVTASTGDQNPQMPSPQFKGLEPLSQLATIRSREELEPEQQSQAGLYRPPTSSSPFGTWNPATPGTLDRSTSDQSMLQIHEQTVRRSSSRFDQIHWKYAKFALLCTLVLFITWVPISTNRVYNLVAPEKAIFGLYLSSAACVPLHGFGNFCIYLSISWTECVEFVTCSGPRRRPSWNVQIQGSKWSKLKGRVRRLMEKRREIQRGDSQVNLRRGSRST